jgi:glycosyltransferase involved in cell wall biosynthesis
MNVILDDIIYSIQQNRGISVYWKEITQLIRNDIEIQVKEISLNKNILFDVSYELNEPHIFHSSYFRTTNNKNAVNILTIHDCIHLKKNNLRNILFHFFLKNKLHKSDIVICVSETTKNDLNKYYKKCLPKRVEVVYNGVDSDFKNYNLKREKSILFIGDRSWYKNLIYSLKIAKLLNYQLIIVGKPLNKKEITLIKGYNIKFSILSNVSTESLIKIYNKISFLIYCSLFEGFGIPMIEAAKCMCPVITLDKPFVREILGDYTIKVDENSFESIFKHLDDEKLMREITERAFEKALDYNWDSAAKSIKKIYMSSLKKDD